MSNIKLSMNALVSHPDVMRWFIWSWKSKSNWFSTSVSLFDTMANTKIDIQITKSTISIFENVHMDILNCPQIVIELYNELLENKDKYFQTIDVNNIFKNFKYSNSILNQPLEHSIDRIGWINWSIWWIIKSHPGKFFLVKDIITISIFNVKHKKKLRLCYDEIPSPPWVKKKVNNIESIYTNLIQSIYNECLR